MAIEGRDLVVLEQIMNGAVEMVGYMLRYNRCFPVGGYVEKSASPEYMSIDRISPMQWLEKIELFTNYAMRFPKAINTQNQQKQLDSVIMNVLRGLKIATERAEAESSQALSDKQPYYRGVVTNPDHDENHIAIGTASVDVYLAILNPKIYHAGLKGNNMIELRNRCEREFASMVGDNKTFPVDNNNTESDN